MNSHVSEQINILVERDKAMTQAISTSQFREHMKKFIEVEAKLNKIVDELAAREENPDKIKDAINSIKACWKSERYISYEKYREELIGSGLLPGSNRSGVTTKGTVTSVQVSIDGSTSSAKEFQRVSSIKEPVLNNSKASFPGKRKRKPQPTEERKCCACLLL